MMGKRNTPALAGQSLVEVVVGLGILVMIVSALARFTVGTFADLQQSREYLAAVLYTQEGLEAVTSIADRRFADLSVGTHGLGTASGFYRLSGASNTWAPYVRSIDIAAVQRDGVGNIVTVGGATDTDTRRITSQVTWVRSWGGTGAVHLVQYFTHWQQIRWLIDTLAQFTPGSRNSTVLTNVSDGEVGLRTLGNLDAPVSDFTVDVGGNSDVMALEFDREKDELYLMTGNHVSGDEVFVYDVSNVTGGTMTFLRSAEAGNTSRDLALSRDYAFVLSHDTSKEVRVIRRSDMALVADWDITSNASPNAIVLDVTVNQAYVGMNKGAGGEFYILDVSNPTVSSPVIVAEVDFGKDVEGVAVGLGHAYLITDDTDGELRIVNLADTSIQATCDLPGKQVGLGVQLSGTRLFITRDVGAEVEFAEYTVDSANPRDCASILAHRPVSAQIGDTPLAFAVDTEVNRALITVADNANNSLLVINLSALTSSSGQLASATMCDAVTFLGAHIYVGCRDNEKTIQVLRGGSGGSGVSFWGTYTSPPFDGGSSAVSWGKFTATETGDGTITYRIRTASTQAGLTSAKWVGPDGTDRTTFSGSEQTVVPDPGASGTQWIQWKAYLTGNGAQTPSLEDVTITIQ